MWSFHARGAINLYKTLGLMPPEAIQEEVLKPDKHVVIPLERLADYAADHMFLLWLFGMDGTDIWTNV